MITIKIAKVTQRSPIEITSDFDNGKVKLANGNITVNGQVYPVIDVKAVRQGINYVTSIAYDDTKPVTAIQEPVVKPVPAPEPAQAPSKPAEAVAKPRFRMHKVAQPVPAPAPAPVETVPEPAPAEPEQPALEELIAQVKELIEPVKPDFEGSLELPDGTLEIRYFKKKE